MKFRLLLLPFLALSCSLALAEDTFYHVPLTSLTLSEGKLPTNIEWSGSPWEMVEALQPYAVLEGDGEAFVGGEGLHPWSPAERAYQNMFLAIRAPKGNPPTGRLFVPKTDLSGMVALKFKLDAASEKPDSKQEFLKAKESYYGGLLARNIPGGAWFRHQETQAAMARGTKATPGMTNPAFNPRRPRSWEDGYDSTYDLFSGGRALSENLQLDLREKQLSAFCRLSSRRIVPDSIANLSEQPILCVFKLQP